jgi:hypothetical protein
VDWYSILILFDFLGWKLYPYRYDTIIFLLQLEKFLLHRQFGICVYLWFPAGDSVVTLAMSFWLILASRISSRSLSSQLVKTIERILAYLVCLESIQSCVSWTEG